MVADNALPASEIRRGEVGLVVTDSGRREDCLCPVENAAQRQAVKRQKQMRADSKANIQEKATTIGIFLLHHNRASSDRTGACHPA